MYSGQILFTRSNFFTQSIARDLVNCQLLLWRFDMRDYWENQGVHQGPAGDMSLIKSSKEAVIFSKIDLY